MKHWEESWKSDAQWRNFDKLQDVSSGDQGDVSSIESNAWYYFSNKMILEGEIKGTKWAVFHLISKHSLNFNFPCIFLMNNYQWVWKF